MTVRHVLTILAVSELARSKRFYLEAFEFPVRVDVSVYVELEMPGGARLGLYEREGFAKNTGALPLAARAGQLVPNELYFHSDEPESAIARLKQAGARELSPFAPRPWGDDAAYFADPDGNVLVIARPSQPS
ncbi:MAG: VOC family protein [Polyangiaceae bacterium]